MNDSKRDEAHKKWLQESFLYFKRLGDERADERKRLIDKIIREHKFWLGFAKANALEAECRAFLNREHKCGDDDGIVFSNQVRIFCHKYLIDMDWVFFAADWLNSKRPHEPDGGIGGNGGGAAPRALAHQVEPNNEEPKKDLELPSI